ncbi:phage major capsid protein [Microbacterium gorillae]|uniref:phage major capsid protein n=1 Tax=Microbacterium gorillae TaxID=1231063 RepID=UPI00058C3AE2|nr:phage major capsid protein [Microbacterium gorillae]
MPDTHPNIPSLKVLTGAAIAPLLIRPLQTESVAIAASTYMEIRDESISFPIITTDPSASWVAENEEIPMSEAAGASINIKPTKLAGLTHISNEIANDSNPTAAGIAGLALARDIAKKIDAAFFGPESANVVQQSGLESIPTGEFTHIDANPATSLEAWVDALAAAEAVGTEPSTWVTDPATAQALAKLKTGTGSNVFLLGQGAENGPSRQVLGVPLVVSPYVLPGTVWGIPRDRSMIIMRERAEIAVDKSFRFGFDQTVIRAVCRVGFGFPHAAGIVKITKTP